LALDPATGDVFVAETLCHHPGAVFRLREGLPPEPLEGVPSDGPLVLDFAAPPAAQKSLATPSSPRSFAACADRPDVECGSLVVPLDWTDPSRGTLELRVVLAPALGADRLGVLAYDLGGPGLSNTEALLTAFPDDLVAGSGATLRGHFDLVALERRGTAHSVPALACSFADGPTLPRRPTPEALAPLLTWATGAATSCRQDPLAAHVDSASVARDLDALREALGEEDLSFLGMSYGTTVGEAYARLFPERVRAFVLVSPMHPRQDQLARVFARTAVEEEGFDAFVAWCAEAGSPACALAAPGEGPAEVRARFDAALAAAGPRRAAVLAELRQRNLFPVRHWREVARRLTGHLCGDPSALPRLLGEDLPARKTGDDETLVANFYAVHALDRPFPQGFDSAALTDAAAWLDQRYPLVGDRVLLGMAPLVGWPPGPPLPSGPTRAPPLLVVTSRGDFATPRDDADAVVAGLGNGSHLLEAQGAGHAVVSSNDCAGNVVTDFLVAPNEAPARTTCPSIPAARWRP
jgi:pimeloyl-ACP methyl ester carboxylesterase